LKPTKKKIVGGRTCFTCASHQSNTRRRLGIGAEVATADWLIMLYLTGQRMSNTEDPAQDRLPPQNDFV
jgi:hypothetical protein